MTEKLFDMLNHVFNLMTENKLRKDIDDTLLEKLLTLFKKLKFQSYLIKDSFMATCENHQNMHFDFTEELLKRTIAVQFIEKVLSSVCNRNESFTVIIKTFGIRLLALIYESPKELFSVENLLKFSLFRDVNNKIVCDHIPSIQHALIACLSSVTRQMKGALWFIDHNLEDFIFSSFSSSSYYVRKSAAKFFIDFIIQWTKVPEVENKTEEYLKKYLKKVMFYITKHINFFRNSKEMNFSECCIFITKQLLELECSEEIIGDTLHLAKKMSECFLHLPEEDKFNCQLIDIFLIISFKSKFGNEIVIEVIRDLIIQEDMNYSFNLAASYSNFVWVKQYDPAEVNFFLLPLYILTNTQFNANTFYKVDSNLIYNTICKKMEHKPNCKLLFCSSLSALQKLVPILHHDDKRVVAAEVIKFIKASEYPHHKWLCSLLEDRLVHHSCLDLLTSFLTSHSSFISEGSDLVFQIAIELLKKPSSDSNFLSQLLLLLQDLLMQHEKLIFYLRDVDKDDLIQVLCRMLLDNRESVVDSAIHVAGQILGSSDSLSWQDRILKHSIHSIIWDIAIHGSHDGSVRSTALKAIIEGCLKSWCLDEMKSSKGITEIDIVKILFDLTYDPDFFLQREALSCLFQVMKFKWNELPSLSRDYLFSGLVSAIKSLDLELKLLSLDVWLWLIEHKFTYYEISPNVKQYVENLINSGFGLSLILAFDDYDEAVKFKAANILLTLKNKLIGYGVSVDSLNINSPIEEQQNYDISIQLQKKFTLKERNEGIDSVMEISTTEQITKICRPPNLLDLYDFKHEYFSVDSKSRKCSVFLFWRYLWCIELVSIVHPSISVSDINSDCESLLNDIIAAKVSELQLVEETPDCY